MKELLNEISNKVRSDFEEQKPILSFEQFLELVAEKPPLHFRSAVQYMRDCFDYFGREEVAVGEHTETRFTLFDAPFDGGVDRLVGQQSAQRAVYRLLASFEREGRINKLIMLHGPNGSAKSTFINGIMRAMEAYSHTEQGALYRFNWVFPSERLTNTGSIGFGGASRAVDPETLDSFAFLEEDQIDAKITSDLNDHPLLLLPPNERNELIKKVIPNVVIPEEAQEPDADVFVLSDYIRRGDLSHTSRQIFDALMNAYRGDLHRVLKHIQVERFFISQRYRVGAITVEPQMRVDAGIRQLTVDRSLSALPTSLQNTTLFEPFGDLVDANRGVIQYDDFLKRHPDLNKYLLATSEKATVSLDTRILHLDALLMATANEDYLDGFKQSADYVSFKGRVELVRVPYLLSYEDEQAIYDDHLKNLKRVQHIAPHTTHVTALWAILTRLHRPKPDRYEKEIREVVSKLTPVEKADLYATGRVPKNLPNDRQRELRALVPDFMTEGNSTNEFEGRYGASPREMKTILLNASQKEEQDHLSPISVFEELDLLVEDPSVFPFLQMKPDGDYHRHEQFIDTVRERYLEIIDDEIRDAMGLVESEQYTEHFDKYVEHLRADLKGEKVHDTIRKTYEEPDEKFMKETEELFDEEIENHKEFREGLISSVAAWSIDHPGEKIDYPSVFPNLFDAMRGTFFEERQKVVSKTLDNALAVFDDRVDNLSKNEKAAVQKMFDQLTDRYGYTLSSAREAIAFLKTNRYKG